MLVEIRGRQDQLQVRLFNQDWNACMEELSKKLMDIQGLCIESIYLFVQYELSKEDCLNIFHLVHNLHMSIASISYMNQSSVLETLYEMDVGNYEFYHDVLILCDIPQHSSITVYHGNLYVFGIVRGEIELISKQSKIYALQIEKLRIKLNDMPMQYIDFKGHCILQYEKRKEIRRWQDQL